MNIDGVEICECPLCGGNRYVYLGTLGALDHFRCQNCFGQWNQPAEDQEVQDA